MASVLDVAAYIRQRRQDVSRMKLLKLVYYAQAWSLVWDGRPLFGEVIEAWPDGPVARDVWVDQRYAGGASGNAETLTEDERATVDEVVRFYGRFSGDELSDLSHSEPPWQIARGPLTSGERSRSVITNESMVEYFSQFQVKPKRLLGELARGIHLLLSVPPDERADLFEEASKEETEAFMREFPGL